MTQLMKMYSSLTFCRSMWNRKNWHRSHCCCDDGGQHQKNCRCIVASVKFWRHDSGLQILKRTVFIYCVPQLKAVNKNKVAGGFFSFTRFCSEVAVQFKIGQFPRDHNAHFCWQLHFVLGEDGNEKVCSRYTTRIWCSARQIFFHFGATAISTKH